MPTINLLLLYLYLCEYKIQNMSEKYRFSIEMKVRDYECDIQGVWGVNEVVVYQGVCKNNPEKELI